MDGITEPAVLVLGHPIAGNPAQFALQRAFAERKLGWRVLSCEVSPEQLPEAIAGAEVLGFRGLLLDQNLVSVDSNRGVTSDLYFRASSAEDWNSESGLTTWLQSEINHHFQTLQRPIRSLLWIGTPDPLLPANIAEVQIQSPIAWASAESIAQAEVIAVSQPIDASVLPACEDQTLIVDFSRPSNDASAMQSLGYRVIGRPEFRIGSLIACFERWTGQSPALDVLTEAVEEYLAI